MPLLRADYMPGAPPEWEEEFVKLAPLRKTDDVGHCDAVVYLARRVFTGHVLVVDGGRTS